MLGYSLGRARSSQCRPLPLQPDSSRSVWLNRERRGSYCTANRKPHDSSRILSGSKDNDDGKDAPNRVSKVENQEMFDMRRQFGEGFARVRPCFRCSVSQVDRSGAGKPTSLHRWPTPEFLLASQKFQFQQPLRSTSVNLNSVENTTSGFLLTATIAPRFSLIVMPCQVIAATRTCAVEDDATKLLTQRRTLQTDEKITALGSSLGKVYMSQT